MCVECVCVCVRVCVSLPEEGMVLYADLPQAFRSTVVGELEANGALKLFILRGHGGGGGGGE